MASQEGTPEHPAGAHTPPDDQSEQPTDQSNVAHMISLGTGKYWRYDKIEGVLAITDTWQRGPAARTLVFVAGRSEPIVSGRDEASILEDIGKEQP